MNRALAVAFLILMTVSSGCRHAGQRATEIVIIPIEQVVANPKAFDRKVISVQACYVSSFERETLQPCDKPSHDQMAWVENAEILYEISQMNRPLIPDPTPPELRHDPEPMFSFQYDQARSQAAWRKLNPYPHRTESYRLFVKAIGQFETIAPNEPEPMRRGYGHLNAYSHRFILVDVLESKPF